MNLAQVQAYLEDDVPTLTPPQTFAHWRKRHVDPRKWEPLSKLRYMFPAEFGLRVRKLGGRKSPVEVNGTVYKSLHAASAETGITRERLAAIAGTARKREYRHRPMTPHRKLQQAEYRRRNADKRAEYQRRYREKLRTGIEE